MPTHFRSGAFLLIAALSTALGACWGTTGPALPDMSVERDQVDRRSERLRLIRQVMREDLAEVQTLRQAFVDAPPGLYARPFPLDLFKHVAVDCLNEPWDPNQLAVDENGPDQPGQDQPGQDVPGQDEPAGQSRLQLTCSPEFVDRLLVDLEEKVPERRSEAIAKLETLDALRQLRGKLRQRLRRIPPILRASRSMLAARRADLRQTRATYARRRTEYSAERWKELTQRLDLYEQNLRALDEQIERLTEAWPSWEPALDQSVSMLYMELTQLSP